MVREVDPADVQASLEVEDDVTVVDIRSPGDYERGHVPGAINVPLPELPRRVDEREWDADEIVCVCPIGQSSVQAARLLGSYEDVDADDVASMAGGYREWDGELESEAPADAGAGAGGDGAGAGGDGGEGGSAEERRSDEGPEAPF